MEQVKKWNKFVELMTATKKAWESLANIDRKGPRFQNLSPKAQKVLTIANTRSKFEVAMPRLMDYWRGYGGLENLLVPMPIKKKEKVDEKDEE